MSKLIHLSKETLKEFNKAKSQIFKEYSNITSLSDDKALNIIITQYNIDIELKHVRRKT